MLETLRRARDLQGLPRTTAARRATSSSTALEAEPGERPVVVGELYFEYHRGVYTTQARTKRAATGAASRRCTTPSSSPCLRGGDYPRAELDRLWKLLLLNQFHDILPGSSIRLVHEEAERDLAEVVAGAEELLRHGPATRR